MKIFRNTDKKLKDLGFKKIREDKFGAQYERYDDECNFTQCVDIMHKRGGEHIIQSYDKNLFDTKKIGNTCVGLTYKENKLFLKKMKELNLG